MMKKLMILFFIFPAFFIFAKQLEIVATSTHIGCCVKEIGKSKVNVTILIPPGICPGHYEIKPGDLKKLCNNGILLYHGWEGFIDDISKAVENTGAKIFRLDVEGNWNIPEVQIKAGEKITHIMVSIDPSNKEFYEKNLISYKKKMSALDRKIKNFVSANKLSTVPVIASKMQQDFLNYLGFNIAGTFGRDEEISPGNITELINKAKTYNVKMIVSNLQSGTSTGEMLSRKTKLPHVILSNFPGGFERTDNVEATIMKNLELIRNAINR